MVETLGSDLSRLAVPALVVVGEHDSPSREPCRQLAELLPDAELVVVPGAGHVVNLARPDAFNEALLGFLRRL